MASHGSSVNLSLRTNAEARRGSNGQPRRVVGMIANRSAEGATLPNLIVYIDRREGTPTNPSLFALSEARRISHAAGLTVFALVMSDPPGAAATYDDLAATLGLAGADRVLVCEGAGLGAPALDSTHGRALLSAAERVPAIVVLFPAGGPGDELGPPLAVRLGAAFAPAIEIQISEESGPLAEGVGRMRMRRWRADRTGYRQLDPVEIERPVIAILGAHGASTQAGTPHIDVEVIACPPPANPTMVELASEPDDLDSVVSARGLILLGPGVAAEVAARLRAAAPAGVAVVEAGHASPAALAAASPELLLEIGRSELMVGVSPRARLGLVDIDAQAEGAAPATGPARSAARRPPYDLVWKPGRADPWDDLIAALSRAAAAGADASKGRA
jgi:hypothetical protein